MKNSFYGRFECRTLHHRDVPFRVDDVLVPFKIAVLLPCFVSELGRISDPLLHRIFMSFNV